MSSRRKGQRTERKAQKNLENNGWNVYKCQLGSKYTKNDAYGITDIIATQPRQPVRFIQIKTNNSNKANMYKEKAPQILPLQGFATFELWIWWNYKGWEKRRLVKQGEGEWSWLVLEDARK